MRKRFIIAVSFFLLILLGLGIFFVNQKNRQSVPPSVSTTKEIFDDRLKKFPQVSVTPVNVLFGTLVGFRDTSLIIKTTASSTAQTYTIILTPETIQMISKDDPKTQSVKLTPAKPGLPIKKGTKISIIGEGDLGKEDFKPLQITYFFE